MEEKKLNTDKIDLVQLFQKLYNCKKLYLQVLSVTLVGACIFILGFPRYYTTDIKLAPELNNSSNSMGSIGSIASSLGFDLSDINTSDAITPLLYPNLMEDNKFICDLFDIKVESSDKTIKSTYYEYLQKHQKTTIWTKPIGWIESLFKSKEENKDFKGFNPYTLSKKDEDIAQAIRGNISIKVDKKTTIITIESKAQDPVICKTIADSVKNRLQAFITDYRTNKARIDQKYYEELTDKAKEEYEIARRKYGSLSDSNSDISLKSFELKLEDLENDMQLKFNTYTTLNTQLQAAKAKVQERTPAFTIIKGAEVPIKPSGPKRMIFVAFCLMLAFAVTSIYILSKDVKNSK